MKLIIFGASGGTGLELVQQALAMGHEVAAFVRNSGQITLSHERLNLVQGDVLNSKEVQCALKNQDAVICSLGAKATSKNMLRATGTKIIIDSMEAAGIRRLVCLSALGCGESRALLPFHYKYFFCPVFLRHVYRDHEAQEKCVRKSNLDWTIIRPAALTDGQLTGSYLHGVIAADKALKMKVSRADVAEFMLKQLNEKFFGKAVCISY